MVTARRTSARRPGPAVVAPNADAVRPMGKVRRSQAITTYGIGAIIDLTAGSVMPLGLEEWENVSRGGRLAPMTVHEPRLQGQLGVSFFRLPPTEEVIEQREGTVDRRYTIPCVRFPQWQECPKCHRIGVSDDPFTTSDDGNRLVCRACGTKAYTNPVRFIAACRHGHIEDFPWVWWAHRHRDSGACTHPALYLLSRSKSASLSDLYVQCKSCKTGSSLGDAFTGESLRKLHCRGNRPWLRDHEPGCDETLRALQRGASNVHFPVIASALSIPPASEPYFQILEDYWTAVGAVPANAVDHVLAGVAQDLGIEAEGLRAAYDNRKRMESGDTTRTELSLRGEEYAALSNSREDEAIGGRPPQFCNEAFPAPDALSTWFDLVGATSRLREVRALTAFSRLEPCPVSGEHIQTALYEGLLSPLSKSPRTWLPAAEIRGEGIFLRFRTAAIDEWIRSNPHVVARAAVLESRSAKMATDRGYTREYTITPRLLLVHSFAHAIIRQLSLDCGYSSSALRERLYISDDAGSPMNGVLIYTGSPDSEGSLGGLVRLAQPELISEAVTRAVRHARWCGSDPVCLETDPQQSGERISGAACHGCLLIPETACEKFNRELDRTLLVGDAESRWTGFFSGLGEGDP
jgi:Domain of unknown function (DUF1998)